MKVSVEQTVEVSDEARALIAESLGQKTATRQDLKDFLWQHGRDWESALTGAPDPAGDSQPDTVPDAEQGWDEPTNVNGVDIDAEIDGMDLI